MATTTAMESTTAAAVEPAAAAAVEPAAATKAPYAPSAAIGVTAAACTRCCVTSMGAAIYARSTGISAPSAVAAVCLTSAVSAASAVAISTAIAVSAAIAVAATTPTATTAVATPTMSPTPAVPGTYANEHTAVKPLRSVIAVRRAAIGVIGVVAPFTHRGTVIHWRCYNFRPDTNSNANINLGIRLHGERQGEQHRNHDQLQTFHDFLLCCPVSLSDLEFRGNPRSQHPPVGLFALSSFCTFKQQLHA